MERPIHPVHVGFRLTGWILATTILLIGCGKRQMREQFIVDSFAAETRALEDKVYQLEARLERLEGDEGSVDRVRPRSAPPPPPTDFSPPEDDDPGDLVPPAVDLGTPVDPTEVRPSEQSNQDDETPTAVDLTLAGLRLGPGTGSFDFDDEPGDDGLTLLLQPVDAQGQILDLAGAVTVVLLDEVDHRRLARWEFTEQEVAETFRSEEDRVGFQLEVSWRTARPPHGDLHVFVRMETPEGQRLETHRRIAADLTGENIVQGWTPRPEGASGSPGAIAVQSPPPAADSGPPPAVYERPQSATADRRSELEWKPNRRR